MKERRFDCYWKVEGVSSCPRKKKPVEIEGNENSTINVTAAV
jgi:hypothetical protein